MSKAEKPSCKEKTLPRIYFLSTDAAEFSTASATETEYRFPLTDLKCSPQTLSEAPMKQKTNKPDIHKEKKETIQKRTEKGYT